MHENSSGESSKAWDESYEVLTVKWTSTVFALMPSYSIGDTQGHRNNDKQVDIDTRKMVPVKKRASSLPIFCHPS